MKELILHNQIIDYDDLMRMLNDIWNKETGINYMNITNCEITNIPKDIIAIEYNSNTTKFFGFHLNDHNVISHTIFSWNQRNNS